MATTYIHRGDVMTFTAPTGGVVAGAPILIGTLLVIPQETVAQTLQFDGYATGVHTVTKADDQEWTEGAAVYWDDSGKAFTTSTSGNKFVGVAAAAVASTHGLTTGTVRLNGVGVA